jgi:hypothetical protein
LILFETYKKMNAMKKITLAVFLLSAVFTIRAQTMYVKPTTGAQTSFLVADIQKLTFSNGDLVVTNTSGANNSFALSDLRYLNFADLTLGTEEQLLASPSFYAYPNPVSHILYLAGTDPLQQINKIEIISLEGRLLLQQNQNRNSTPQVAVSSLPQGLYLCKVTSDTSSQTIKFIKQ